MQDRITEILAELKGMERQGMSQGGRPLTADEYTSQQVNFYDFPGIDVSVAPPADPDDDDDDDDQPLRPNILTPVSDREETSVFDAQVISSSGRPRFERLNAQQSLDRFTDKDLDINGDNRFENFIERTKAGAEKIGGGVGLVASAALGPATSGLMLAGASLNRKRQRENANAIMRSNNTGGSIFEFNGQVVSRAPGARNFDGTFANTSNEELQRLEAISMNAVPGTFFEVPKDDDSGEFQPDPTRIKNGIFKDEQSGIIVDAFGTVHSASGRLTATHGKTGRAGVMRAALAAAGVPNYDFNDAQARQFIQTYRQDRPTFGTARGMDKGTYDSKLNAFGTTATSILAGMGIRRDDPQLGTSAPEPKVPETGPPRQTGGIMTEAEPMVTAGDGGPDDGAAAAAASLGSTSGARGGPRGFVEERENREREERNQEKVDRINEAMGRDRGFRGFNDGGRVGMQVGGVAAEPAGFVEGPPENFTEKQTVADDKPMSVAEGTFVINAAAVEFAGSDDIKSMLVKAYAKLQKKLDKSPSRVKIPTEDEIDVAVSRGEVIVPPELAKIIGYDRLEKINNRGKKEVSRRQKKAGGGFLAGKKFAEGGEADYEDRIITDEVRRKMKALVESLPDDVDVQSVYLQDGYPERQRYEDERARLNETLPTKGRFFSRGQVISRGGTKRASEPMINVPMTPTLYNLAILAEEVAHQDAYKYRQTYDPEKHKVDRETFFREQNYLEELRAKDFALTVVGGLLPKGDKTARGARASYEKDFAEHLALTDNRELVAAYVKKYPELNRFIKEVSYPEAKIGSKTLPAGSFLSITDDNYYGPGQPKVNPNSSFLRAANREDIVAMNEYHASFGYMLDKLKYLVTQIFDPYVTEPRYVEGYTASLPD